MVEPPSLPGGEKLTAALALPAMALMPVGAPGSVKGSKDCPERTRRAWKVLLLRLLPA